MKFSIKLYIMIFMISAIALIQSSFALKNNVKYRKSPVNQLSTSYNILAFGDMGEIDYFAQIAMPKPNFAVDNQQQINNKIEDWYKEILDNENTEAWKTDGKYGCKVSATNKKPPQMFELEKQNGLENWKRILLAKSFKKQMENIQGYSFLGDLIYPETKFLQKQIEIQDPQNPNRKERKVVFEQGGRKDKWKKRVECGWNIFLSSLQTIGLVDKQGQLTTKVDILPGNHSFDVSITQEENLLLKQKHNKKFIEISEKQSNILENQQQKKKNLYLLLILVLSLLKFKIWLFSYLISTLVH